MSCIRSMLVALVALVVISSGCSAQQFTQADLAGTWSGILGNPNPSGPIGTYAYYTVTFSVDTTGNIIGQFQYFAYPLPLCPAIVLPQPFLSGTLLLSDASTGAVSGTIVVNNAMCGGTFSFTTQPDVKLSQPGVSGRSFRMTGTFSDAPSTSMPLDISGGARQYQQSDIAGIWNGTYVWNDGTGTLAFPYPIPTLQFNVDAQGNISGNGFSGTLLVDGSGQVTGSIIDPNIGTTTLTAADNVLLKTPGQNGLPFRIVTPPPFVGYSIDISGPAAPPPPPPPPPVPTITSPLVAIGYVAAPFSYTIAASGPAPITFGASNLPAGLSFSGVTISGTPTAAGSFPVTLSATNANGTSTLTITVAIGPATQQNQPPGSSPPTISSPPMTNGTLAAAGDAVTFTVAAANAKGNGLTFTWDFGDGTTITDGATITHVYAAGGAYLVTVTVSNGSSVITSTPVPIDIADGRVDLGTVSLSKGHGKFGLTIAVPAGFPKHGVKSQFVLGSLPDGVKYSNLKLRGKTSATGTYTFALDFTSRKPSLTKRIIYTVTLTQ